MVRIGRQGPTWALDRWCLLGQVLAHGSVLLTMTFLLIGVFCGRILLSSLFSAGDESLLPASKEEGVISGGGDMTATL